MRNKIRSSLKVSFWDGIFASLMNGFTADYITPYALALKATNSQIGFLSAIPSFASSLVQFKSADITDWFRSRKKVITIFVLLQVLMGIPIVLVPYLFSHNPIVYLILFVTLFTAANAVSTPAWISLMSDYVPPKSRGRYFGWRNKIILAITICASFIAGLILQASKKDILKGFLIILSAAVIARLISWVFLTRMYEPHLKVKKEDYFSFLDFIRRVKESNFAKFVLFVSCLNFSVNIASPFFSVFMLSDLKFNYLTYTVITITVTIVQIFIIGRWGKQADRIGNVRVMKFTSVFIAALPILWLFNYHPVYLVFIQMLSGFAWSGFNLCTVNFIFDAARPEKRTRCFAYFSVCAGFALCCGALLGGYLANIIPKIFGYKLLTLFLISGILRALVVLVFSGLIKEVRPAAKISSGDLFYSVLGIKEIPLTRGTRD